MGMLWRRQVWVERMKRTSGLVWLRTRGGCIGGADGTVVWVDAECMVWIVSTIGDVPGVWVLNSV